MKSQWTWEPWLSALGLAAALLTACAARIGEPGSVPISGATRHVRGHGDSWISPEARGRDLVYALGGCAGTCILAYPKGTLVGAIPGYISRYFGAVCSDSGGNVFLSDNSTVFEFAHGGTTPIATFSLPGTQALGCSVDPMTGDLAVVFNVSSVAVFSPGSATPVVLSALIDAHYCGYDNSGNLFVDGYDGQKYSLSELPKDGTAFEKLSLDQSVGQPGQVQWDGEHLSYESVGSGQETISQLSVSGSSVTVFGQTVLRGVRRRLEQSWIYKNVVVVPYGNFGPNARNVGIWKYPTGGAPTNRITKFDSYNRKMFDFFGATVSVAQ